MSGSIITDTTDYLDSIIIDSNKRAKNFSVQVTSASIEGKPIDTALMKLFASMERAAAAEIIREILKDAVEEDLPRVILELESTSNSVLDFNPEMDDLSYVYIRLLKEVTRLLRKHQS